MSYIIFCCCSGYVVKGRLSSTGISKMLPLNSQHLSPFFVPFIFYVNSLEKNVTLKDILNLLIDLQIIHYHTKDIIRKTLILSYI